MWINLVFVFTIFRIPRYFYSKTPWESDRLNSYWVLIDYLYKKQRGWVVDYDRNINYDCLKSKILLNKKFFAMGADK